MIIMVMLLAISNMGVYSAFGNYQKCSFAIRVSTDYKNASTFDEITPFAPLAALAGVVSIIGTPIVVGLVVAGAACAFSHPIRTSMINENYARYDFSEFDN